MDLFGVYLGDRLGLYRALADAGPLTSGGLAEAAGIHERYAREWLEQQAATGILEVDDPDAAAPSAATACPPATTRCCSTRRASTTLAPLAQLIVAVRAAVHAVLDAFRTGDGVPYADYGADLLRGPGARSPSRCSTNLLGERVAPGGAATSTIASLAEPPARVADIACGCGWSSIAIARGYPQVTVDGIDLDAASIATARENLAAAASRTA